jgi:hypothetical protein
VSVSNQVIRFAMVDFEGKVTANPLAAGSDVMIYKVEAETALSVAFEGATGVFTTYQYRLKPGDTVFIYNNVIHIPERCVAQQPGNTIRCQG